jgi:hypothetical protein
LWRRHLEKKKSATTSLNKEADRDYKAGHRREKNGKDYWHRFRHHQQLRVGIGGWQASRD